MWHAKVGSEMSKIWVFHIIITTITYHDDLIFYVLVSRRWSPMKIDSTDEKCYKSRCMFLKSFPSSKLTVHPNKSVYHFHKMRLWVHLGETAPEKSTQHNTTQHMQSFVATHTTNVKGTQRQKIGRGGRTQENMQVTGRHAAIIYIFSFDTSSGCVFPSSKREYSFALFSPLTWLTEPLCPGK